MKVTFKNIYNEDYTYEGLEIIVDGVSIGKIDTSTESPEDNTLGRMGVEGLIVNLIKSLKPEIEVENVSEEI